MTAEVLQASQLPDLKMRLLALYQQEEALQTRLDYLKVHKASTLEAIEAIERATADKIAADAVSKVEGG